MLCNKYMTWYNATQFWLNKVFAENADYHDWKTAHNMIGSEFIKNIFKTNIYLIYIHSYNQF